MKRLIFILVAAICGLHTVRATDNIVVPNLTISQGGEGLIDIQLNNELPYVTFAFTLNLPEGINYVDMELSEERFAPQAGQYLPIKDPSDDGRAIGLGSLGITENSIAGNSGTLVTVKITADETLEMGTILNATITGIKFSTNDDEKTLEDVAFTITIGEPADTRKLFDENSDNADVLKAATGVDVRVKRTIKADQWSTICLPFAMTEAQVKAAFGDDVQLADFTGCEATYDETGKNIIALKVNFDDVTAIEANHPYIIKVSEPLSDFTVDDVDVTPVENPSVDRDESSFKMYGIWYYMYNRFVGTYKAETEIPENSLFLNTNKFWYSKGKNKTKAFRGYFAFYMLLNDVSESSARVAMRFNNNITDIDKVSVRKPDMSGAVFDLQGRRVNKPIKGIFIKDGKKIVIEN